MNQSFTREHRRLSIPRPLFAALDWDPDVWLRFSVLGGGRMLIESVPAQMPALLPTHGAASSHLRVYVPLLRNRVTTMPLQVCEAMDVQHGDWVRLTVLDDGTTLLEKASERAGDELARATENRAAAVGRYLGALRNAADHGVDPDEGTAWVFRPHTGIEYVFVAASFIRTVRRKSLENLSEF